MGCRWIHDNSNFFRGKTVLELGSGVAGVSGCVASFYSSKCLLTDLPQVVPLLKENVKLNSSLFGKCKPQVGSLDWKSEQKIVNLRDGVDVILGADIFYDSNLSPHLVSVIHRYLRSDGSFFGISPTQREGVNSFSETVAKYGFEVKSKFPGKVDKILVHDVYPLTFFWCKKRG